MLFRIALVACSVFLLIVVAHSANHRKTPDMIPDAVKQTAPSAAESASFVSAKDYGAIADGKSHPLSSVYGTLAAARALYPYATSLSQEVDYLAVKAASNAALGADGAEHGYANKGLNKPIYLPAGTYVLGDDTWLIRNAVGAHIYGAGRLATTITSNNTVFRTDGLWYPTIEGICFHTLTSSGTVAVDVDGNVPGHPYETRGIQGVTFKDCLFDGGGSTYAFALARQGGSGAQGSENLFLDCHFKSATTAAYYQNGFNALDNTFIGGDMQDYSKHGIQIIAGSLRVLSTSFESTHQYTQILNDGWDIDASSAGVGERIVVIGCRTESLRFYRGAFSQAGVLIGNQQRVSVVAWTPNTPYSLNTVVIGKTARGEKLFRVTTAGTGGGIEPTWPTAGTAADGSVTWTETEFDAVNMVAGEYATTNSMQVGNVVAPFSSDVTAVEVAGDYTVPRGVSMVLVDATIRNVTITLPTMPLSGASVPAQPVTVKKYDTSSHTVTIQGGPNNIETPITIPGGSRGYVTLINAGGGNLSGAFWITSKSF